MINPCKRYFSVFYVFLTIGLIFWGCTPSKQVAMDQPVAGMETPWELEVQQLPARSGTLQNSMPYLKQTVLAIITDNEEELQNFLGQLEEDGHAEDSVVFFQATDVSAQRSTSIYLLYGWSGWGGDDMRKISIDSTLMVGNAIDIYTSRPQLIYDEPIMGTADMKFVGWHIAAGQLSAGEYFVRLHEKRDEIKVELQPYSREILTERPYQEMTKIAFTVAETD